MKKVLKTLRGLSLAVVILLIVIVVAIHFFAGLALRVGIEKAATKTLSVEVSVSDVDLSLLRCKLRLEGLVVDNPPGYQYERFLELREVRVNVDMMSLLSDTVEIEEISLDGMDIVIEQKGLSNNLKEIMKSVKSDKPKDKPAEQEKPKKAGKKLKIGTLEISNVTVKAKLLPVPGKADTVTFKLAPIKMTNLGEREHLDTAVLSSKILLAITEGVAEQGVGILPKDMIGSVKGELKRLEGLSETLLDNGSKVLEGGKDIGKEVTEGLKGLFKPKDK